MVETCELEVPRRELLECPPCTEIFFERISQIRIGRHTIVVIRRYQLRKCFQGLAVGNHVHSLTLLPQEEVEIEIVRRSKYSRALHEQRSVESEFRFELQSTARDEWSSEEEVNWKVSAELSGGLDFKVIEIGAKTSGEYSERTKTAEAHLREVINKTSSSVSRKYEVAIDTKSEVENQYRSLRKLSNPNPCQPVIYHYYQLAKMFKTELILTDIRFDFIAPQLPLPPILRERLHEVAFSAGSPYRQNLNLQVVAPPPPWTLKAAGQTATQQLGLAQPALAQFAAFQSFAQPTIAQLATPVSAQLASPIISIAALPSVRVPVEPPDVLRLTKDELLEKIREASPEDIDQFSKELNKFLKDEINQLGVRDVYEYCINTPGLYVETTLSKCAACDEATLQLRELEVETARVELELKRRQLENGDDGNEEGGGHE